MTETLPGAVEARGRAGASVGPPHHASLLHPDAIFTGARLCQDTVLAIGADGRVQALLTPADAAHSGVDIERLPGQVLMPGLCDAHSHAFQRAIRGRVQHRIAGGAGATADSFWSWRAAMYRAANGLDPDGVEAISALAFLELLRAGVTAVGEFHYLHHQADGVPYADPDELAERVLRAAHRVGLRIALLRVCYGAAGFDAKGAPLPLHADQRRFASRGPEDALAAIARLRARHRGDDGVRFGVAPHSVRAVPQAWLRALATFDGVIHAHVAEQPAEVAACLAALGRSPLQVFADAGLVDERFAAVHLTHPSPGDKALLQAASAGVVVCPSTELDLGDGLLPLELRDGVRLAVGSDSYAAVEPLAEARSVELHGRAQSGRRLLLGAQQVADGSAIGLNEATAILTIASGNGHRLLGMPGGSLEPGAPADACAVDLNRPEAEGVPPLVALSHVARPEWVRSVWVGGVRRLRDRRHFLEEEIAMSARITMNRLWNVGVALLLGLSLTAGGCDDDATVGPAKFDAEEVGTHGGDAGLGGETRGGGGPDSTAEAGTICQTASQCPAPSDPCRAPAC